MEIQLDNFAFTYKKFFPLATKGRDS